MSGAAGRPGGPGGGPRGGMMGMGMGLPPTKARDFGGSLRRLLGGLRPEAPLVIVVVVLAVVSVTFAILGPKILGEATNLIFEGAISAQLPSGVTTEQVVAGLRASGQDQQADMLSTMTLTPGQGIDFDALARILLVLVGVYLLSSLFAWLQAYIMAGVTQRTVLRLRADVEAKLGRLPLSTFDSRPRGRPAEPGHQRHRQHRPVAPAEPDPAHHVAAHDRRGARR